MDNMDLEVTEVTETITEVEEETEVEVRSRLYKGIRERSRFRAPLHPP